MRIKGSNTTKKPAVAVATRSMIAQQTASFLQEGGTIQEVPRGISGQQPRSYAPSSGQKTAAKKS